MPNPDFMRAFAVDMNLRFVPSTEDAGIVPYVVIFSPVIGRRAPDEFGGNLLVVEEYLGSSCMLLVTLKSEFHIWSLDLSLFTI